LVWFGDCSEDVVVDDELTVMMILFWREEEVSYTSLEYWIVELFFFIWRCGIPTLYVFPPLSLLSC
jgi:hypothetical protein